MNIITLSSREEALLSPSAIAVVAFDSASPIYSSITALGSLRGSYCFYALNGLYGMYISYGSYGLVLFGAGGLSDICCIY